MKEAYARSREFNWQKDPFQPTQPEVQAVTVLIGFLSAGITKAKIKGI